MSVAHVADSAAAVPNEAASRFWRAVRACLEEFHHYSPPAARQAVREYWPVLHDAAPAPGLPAIYHEQPYRVAADLAGCADTDLSEDRAVAYEAILERHGW